MMTVLSSTSNLPISWPPYGATVIWGYISPIDHGWELVNGYCRQCATQNLPFRDCFRFHQYNRINITLTLRPIQKLKMKLPAILTLIANHQLSWSYLMNIKYLYIALYIELAYCFLIIYWVANFLLNRALNHKNSIKNGFLDPKLV